MKPPNKSSGSDVERSHITARALWLAVGGDCSGDDQVFIDQRRRCHSVQSVVRVAVGRSFPKVNGSFIPKAGNRQAFTGVERDQAAIKSSDQYAAFLSTLPIRDAAIRILRIGAFAVELWIERPDLLAGLRIEGDDPAKRRRNIHDAVGHHRSGFKCGTDRVVGAVANIACVIHPGDFETVDVFLVNLAQRGVPGAGDIRPIVRPFLALSQSRSQRGTQPRPEKNPQDP